MIVRAFDRHVGAGPHRDADRGFGQRRRVVHAVTGHRDTAALLLEPAHDIPLLVGQDAGDDLIDPECPGHRTGGRLVVAREHHQRQTVSVQQRVSPAALVGLIGSATARSPARRAVDGDVHHRLTLVPAHLCVGLWSTPPGTSRPARSSSAAGADHDPSAVHDSGDAAAGRGLESRSPLGTVRPRCRAPAYDRGRERVLAGLFQTGRQTQHVRPRRTTR